MPKRIDTPAALRRWVAAGRPGDAAVYHLGNLAADRREDVTLHALADLVEAMVAAELLRHRRGRVSGLDASAYVAVVADAARREHPLVTAAMSPLDWRVLRALHTREERVSGARAVARALGIEEGEAAHALDSLRSRGWVDMAPSDRGSPHAVPSAAALRWVV